MTLTVFRVLSSVLALFAASYWLRILTSDEGGHGAKALAAILVAGASVMLAASPLRGHASALVRMLALGAGIAVFGGAFLLNQWIRGDYERYVWIIRQPAPCTYMGGGPGGLWVLVMGSAFTLGAVGYAFVGGLERRLALAGIAIAVTLLGLAALAMFPDPAIFAAILGCV